MGHLAAVWEQAHTDNFSMALTG